MRSAWVGLVCLVACSQPDRPVVPKHPEPEPAPPAAPPVVAAKAPPISTEQKFAPAAIPPAFADPDRRKKLEAAFPAIDKALEQEHVRGFAVGIVIDGELAWSKGYGVVDPASKVVPDADTVYRIGSISKSFTGLAVMSLRDEGKLDLDDPLVKWIPEASGITYPTRDERPITLRQLATHTSGLQRDATGFDQEADPSEAVVTGSLAKLTLERAPGLESVYSNLGFGLLGIVASHAAHQPLRELVAARIFTPLGMTSSGYESSSAKLAPAFGPDDKPKSPARLGAISGAGQIYSSVRDMARYAAFLLAAYPPRDGDDAGPIKRATIREAQHGGFFEGATVSKPDAKSGEPSVDLRASRYGFGWVQEQTCSASDRIWHNGAIDSYRAALVLRVDRGVGVVVLTNFGNVDTMHVADRALELLAATGAMKPRVAAQPDPSTYTPQITAMLDVYNTQDKDKLAALLARPMDPREPDEIAHYKALHGACTAFKFLRAENGVTFALTCEHGPFELQINPVANGKIGGFNGRTPGAVPPPAIKKVITAAIGLTFDPTWSDASYKIVFPKSLIPVERAKRVRDELRVQSGSCKAGTITENGIGGWDIDLICTKQPLVLSLHFDKDSVLDGIFFHPAAGADGSPCPTK